MQEITTELLGKDRLDLNDARWVLGEATHRLMPSGELDGWWDGYSSVAMAFAASEDVCAQSLVEMRSSLEYVRPLDSAIGENLIAASKMVLSALVVFIHNPTGGLLYERDIMHDDIDPLVRKAVELLDAVAAEVDAAEIEYGSACYPVEFDAEFPQRVMERNERNRMKFLIDTAVRPVS